jgi:hypothetical protein
MWRQRMPRSWRRRHRSWQWRWRGRSFERPASRPPAHSFAFIYSGPLYSRRSRREIVAPVFRRGKQGPPQRWEPASAGDRRRADVSLSPAQAGSRNWGSRFPRLKTGATVLRRLRRLEGGDRRSPEQVRCSVKQLLSSSEEPFTSPASLLGPIDSIRWWRPCFRLRGDQFLVRRTSFCIPGTSFLVPRTRFLVP